ncbi:hypothetical protein D3C71_2232800 [compost metagenome]
MGKRSITSPANKEKKVTGINWVVPTSPSRKGEPVSFSTSQDWPIFCIQVPISETHWPNQ